MFSDRIKELREKSGLTLTDFAKSIGASTDTIRKYEAGDVTPRKKTVEKICEVYVVTEDWLMGEQKKPELIVEAAVISEEQEPAPVIDENGTPKQVTITISTSQPPILPPIPPVLGLFLFHQAVRHQFMKRFIRKRW